MRDTQLSTIASFCKAAELSGFTAAANALGLTPAALSRSVARLELRLGVKLFRRSTRSVQLTDEGQSYYVQCRAALAQIDEAERGLRQQQARATGLLRVSAPSTYALYRLPAVLAAFAHAQPDITVELHTSNRNVDFVEEGFDLAIRLGEPPDSQLVARKLEDAPLGLYASAAYLQRHGQPQSLAQLQDGSSHSLLAFVRPSTGRVLPWRVLAGAEVREFVPQGRITCSGDPLAAVALAQAGAGVVQTFQWLAQSTSPALEPVLPQCNGATRPFHALYPHNRHLPARVRLFLDALVAHASKENTQLSDRLGA